MNDNLTSMIDQADQHSTDLPTETDLMVEDSSTVSQPALERFDIGVAAFPDWFDENHVRFADIGHVRASIADVDPRQDLIFKIPDPKGETFEDGRLKKRLRLFEDANKIPVLNLPGSDMTVYKNNSFRIVYDLGDGKFIKSYGVKTGLINVFCVLINNVLIPYAKEKMKRKNDGINIIEPNLTRINSKLAEQVDTEALQLHYKQITKSIAEISTAQSAVNWFQTKVGDVQDVNHLLQIDDVIIMLVN